MPKSITYNNRTKVAQTQSQVQPPLPMTENAQQQPNQAQQFFINAVSGAAGYAAQINQIVFLINRRLFQMKINRIPTRIDQYINLASKSGMTNEAQMLGQFLANNPNETLRSFSRAAATYTNPYALTYLSNFASEIGTGKTDLAQKVLSQFTKDEIKFLISNQRATNAASVEALLEMMVTNPEQWRGVIRTNVAKFPEIANGRNILPLDKLATDTATIGKGNKLLTAIEEINVSIKNPALTKLTATIRQAAPSMPNIIFGALGIALSSTDLIIHINKMNSRKQNVPERMSEEERAEYNEDIYQFVVKCISVIGNALIMFPPTATLGSVILGITFAAGFAPAAAKSLGTSTAHMEIEDLLLLGNPVGQLNFLNKAKNKRYFENEQQMQAIQQQAEQNLSVAADTSDPDVQAVLTFIKARLPLYSNGMEVNKAALMGKAIDDFLGSNEAKTWENPEKWKWLKERNANDMKYKNLTTAIAQMSKQLPTKPITMTNYPQVYNNNQFGSQAYRNTGQIQQNYIPNARYKTT